MEEKGKKRKNLIFVGVFFIGVGIFTILWQGEYMYPILLFLSGAIFLCLAYWQSRGQRRN
jgi:hypothetical protein